MHHPEFERLCDMADVKGLSIGIRAGEKLRGIGAEQYRDLESIVVSGPKRPIAGAPGVRINGSIDAAARRLLEAIT
jgi:hypothetical protein